MVPKGNSIRFKNELYLQPTLPGIAVSRLNRKAILFVGFTFKTIEHIRFVGRFFLLDRRRIIFEIRVYKKLILLLIIYIIFFLLIIPFQITIIWFQKKKTPFKNA